MQGAISNIEALERWYKGVNAPLFTLSYYSTQSPTGQGSIILRNTKETDIERGWALLKETVIGQTGFGRAQLHVTVYATENGNNNPNGRTNIDIASNIVPSIPNGYPGIGALPGLVPQSEIDKAVAAAQEKWELKARIQALEEQPDDGFIEKVERIMSLPSIQMIVSGFMSKHGMAVPVVNGPYPSSAPGPSPITGTPPVDDDVEQELDNLEAIAAQHGMTLKEFLAKTAALAAAQPGVVQMLAKQ